VIIGGQLVEPLPSAEQARTHAAERLAHLPAPCHSLFESPNAWRVDVSMELECLYERISKGVAQ
jgi:hypothetical protein